DYTPFPNPSADVSLNPFCAFCAFLRLFVFLCDLCVHSRLPCLRPQTRLRSLTRGCPKQQPYPSLNLCGFEALREIFVFGCFLRKPGGQIENSKVRTLGSIPSRIKANGKGNDGSSCANPPEVTLIVNVGQFAVLDDCGWDRNHVEGERIVPRRNIQPDGI